MKRKIGSLLVAVAIVAFAAPAMAGASTGLTDGGVLVPVGTTITGSNVGSVTTTAATLGNTTCESLMFNVELNQNSATAGFTALGIATGSMSGCVWKGTAVQATNVTIVSISSPAGSSGTGKASFSYEIDYPGLTCKYAASGAAFSYTVGSDAINLTSAALTSSPAACGPTTFDASVTLTTAKSGTPIVIM